MCDDEVGVFEDEPLREERDRSYVPWDLEVAGFVVHPDRGDDSDVEVGDGIEDQLEQIWRVERRSEGHVHQRPFVLAVQLRRDRLARCRLGFAIVANRDAQARAGIRGHPTGCPRRISGGACGLNQR